MTNNNLNIAVIGASGAIGEEFITQFLEQKNVQSIFAFSRSQKIFSNPKVTSHFIDLEDEKSIELAAKVAAENGALDIVIIASGFLSDQNINPEKSLRDLSAEKFEKLFKINATGPALVAKYFLPLLNKNQKSIFAAISARVSSISDNYLGGWYAYRASKSALNMILKNAAIEVKRSNKNAVIIGLHPGTVDSNLSKPFHGNVKKEKLFTPQYSGKKVTRGY